MEEDIMILCKAVTLLAGHKQNLISRHYTDFLNQHPIAAPFDNLLFYAFETSDQLRHVTEHT